VPDPSTVQRASRHAALGDPIRLAIADELAVSDRAPMELQAMFGLPSNLLSHHLDVLENVGLISRHRSSGDGRRRYIRLETDALTDLTPRRDVRPSGALFVCTRNSARSQLAAALWRELSGRRAASAGTHPADAVHPEAVAAAQRRGLDIAAHRPASLDAVKVLPELVVTVCDRAHEELDPDLRRLHWSVPDPVPSGTKAAFDAARDELEERIIRLLTTRAAA